MVINPLPSPIPSRALEGALEGIGCHFEVDSEEIAGGSLVYQDRLCHMAAFPVNS